MLELEVMLLGKSASEVRWIFGIVQGVINIYKCDFIMVTFILPPYIWFSLAWELTIVPHCINKSVIPPSAVFSP